MPKYKRPSSWGYVYIIKSDTGLYKIGLTTHPKRRLEELQKAYYPERLRFDRLIETDNMMATERQLHNIFARKHVLGEWFALSEKDFDLVDRVAENIRIYLDDLR